MPVRVRSFRQRLIAVVAAVSLAASGLLAISDVAAPAAAVVSCPAPRAGTPAENGISGTGVDIKQLIKQYAANADPTFAAAIDTTQDPVTVAVGSDAVSLTPLANCPGVLTGTSATGLAVLLRYNWMPEVKALTYTVELSNPTVSSITNVRVKPFQLRLNAGSTIPCVRYHGGVNPGWDQHQTVFGSASTAAVDLAGGSSAATTPILDVALNESSANQCSDTAAAALAGFYLGFAWAGAWQFHAGWNAAAPGAFEVVADTPNASPPAAGQFPNSTFSVAAGATVIYPTVELGFFSGPTWQSLDRAQVRYVATKLRPQKAGTNYPVTYDSWFGIEGQDTGARLREEARAAAAVGAEAFTIDAGWYVPYGQLLPLGNWFSPSPGKYPAGSNLSLPALCDYVRSLGMRCGLWTLFQESDTASDAYTTVTTPGPVPSCPNVPKPALTDASTVWAYQQMSLGGQALQMQNSDAVLWTEYMASCVIEAYGLTYYRFETVAPGGGYLPVSEPYSGVAYGNGMTRVLDDLRAKYPQVVFEASEAGGGRMNFSTLARSEQNWGKDGVYDPAYSAPQQLVALRLWPANYAALSDVTCLPNLVRIGCSPAESASAYGVMSRMAGRLTFDGDVSAWTPAQVAQVRSLVATYKQFRDLMDQPAYFPFPQRAPAALQDWDAVVFGSSADTSPDQLMYTYRGTAAAATTTFTPPPGPGTGWRLVQSSSGSPSVTANAGGSVTVSQDPKSIAVWRRVVTATAPQLPSDLAAAQNKDTVVLTWQHAPGAQTVIERSTDGTTWSAIGVADAANAQYVDSDVQPGTSYQYRARAVSTQGAASAATAAVSVTTGTTLYPAFVDDLSNRIAYSSGFTHSGNDWSSSLSGGIQTVTVSDTAGSVATVSCAQCTGLTWLGRTGPNYGHASIQVDQNPAVDVDLYAARLSPGRGQYSVSGLALTSHVMTVRVAGVKNASSQGIRVDVDGFLLTEDQTPTGLVDDAARTIQYTGVKAFTGYQGLFQGTAHSTDVQGGGFNYTCFCRKISWWSHTRPGFAAANVTVDGGSPVPVNTGTSPARESHAVYDTSWPTAGRHTITVAKSDANGTWLELDALQVTS